MILSHNPLDRVRHFVGNRRAPHEKKARRMARIVRRKRLGERQV